MSSYGLGSLRGPVDSRIAGAAPGMVGMRLVRWLTGVGMEQDLPERRRIVVDGSNIATEGRSLPSLAQLDEAIRAFLEEYPGFTTSDVTVVVDASFGHRIDPSEVSAFDQAVEHGEIITPPAGAIGRGDGFILRIAEKSGALVLSNDSFQEFHAERPWLFEAGRLIGGKPVPGVGWIFTPRTPVRGARSRSVTAKSKRGQTASDTERDLPSDEFSESGPEPVPSRAGRRARGTASTASATATKAAKSTKTAKAAGADRPAETAKSHEGDGHQDGQAHRGDDDPKGGKGHQGRQGGQGHQGGQIHHDHRTGQGRQGGQALRVAEEICSHLGDRIHHGRHAPSGQSPARQSRQSRQSRQVGQVVDAHQGDQCDQGDQNLESLQRPQRLDRLRRLGGTGRSGLWPARR